MKPTRTRSPAGYVGRFAPSPTGPLHFGSLVAAIGSWLDARSHAGRWLLRMDDLDTPRNAPGAVDAIARELERLGLAWDGSIVLQSDDPQRYHAAIETLLAASAAFRCGCSRKDLRDGIYPGTCRFGVGAGRSARSVRLRVGPSPLALHDLVQGDYEQRLPVVCGDFVIARADGIAAYHLATVVDDARTGVTRVVRGADLLESTPRQLALQRALGLPTPEYAHLPLALDARGQKLSKQNHAEPTHGRPATALWWGALVLLGHPPPAALQRAPLAALQEWAATRWQLQRVPATAHASAARGAHAPRVNTNG